MKDNYDDDNLDNDNYIDDYNEDNDDLYEIDNILDDVIKSQPTKKRRKTPEEYYVKGADLINEIKKYHESKRQDAEARNVPYAEL